MKLPVQIAAILQRGFNQLLDLDPDIAGQLQPIEGKLVRLHLRGLETDAWVLIHSDHVEVLEDYDAPANVTISGAPFSLLSVITTRQNLFEADVSIEGDLQLARRFSRLLQQLDIDWQEHLSSLLGDTVAHKLGVVGVSFGRWASRAKVSVESNLADYLRDETGHLPHGWELLEFTDEVDELRDRVARLQQLFDKSEPRDEFYPCTDSVD